MAGAGEVTLGVSRHLPAAESCTRARSCELGASQAEGKRRNRAFLWSQASGGILHPASQAGEGGQATKLARAAPRGPGRVGWRPPNRPYIVADFLLHQASLCHAGLEGRRAHVTSHGPPRVLSCAADSPLAPRSTPEIRKSCGWEASGQNQIKSNQIKSKPPFDSLLMRFIRTHSNFFPPPNETRDSERH
jgi:hypothetical protein